MNADTVRQFLTKRPFEPFEVRLSSGDVHRVVHPEFAILLPHTLVVGYPKPDRVAVCELAHVSSIERVPATAS